MYYVKREILHIKNEELCIKNDEFCSDFHTGQVDTSSSAVSFLSHFPYADSAWNGEGFNGIFNGDADGWLINFNCGFQHGIAVDMLGSGSNYKAKLFGASHRNDNNTPALWELWDEFNTTDPACNMIGWWEDDPAATAMAVLAPPPPPPSPVPSPSSDWKSYPNKSVSGPNVTPCLCKVSPNDSKDCTCELCCPVQGESVLNITLRACEAACLGQGAATGHTPGKSCTVVNFSLADSGCVFRAMSNGHTGAPATQVLIAHLQHFLAHHRLTVRAFSECQNQYVANDVAVGGWQWLRVYAKGDTPRSGCGGPEQQFNRSRDDVLRVQ